MTDPALTIAVSTLGPRAETLRGDRLPALPGVAWLILVQQAGADLPAFPGRPDVTVTALPGRGAARSRNAAIDLARGAALLFADDDLTFAPAGLAALRDRLAQPGGPDILLARLTQPGGALRKAYRPDGTRMTRANIARSGTPEIALRLAPLRRAGVRFDEAFGAGTAQWMGDEFIFLADALRAGLTGQHAAIVLAEHPADSSGLATTAEAFAIRRAVFIRALGARAAIPARVAFALMRWRRFPSWAVWWAFLRP